MLSNYSNPAKCASELDKQLKPTTNSLVINKAFVNYHNKQLYIITNDKKTIESVPTQDEEYIAIEVKNKTKENNLLIISAYVHPNSNTDYNFIPKLMNKYKNAITIGDLNAHYPSWYCTKTNKKG